ncbi:YczE/YyaS/YitT family protein [Virgibacillus ndiopensis]|uniref:YczE/YyaS/YitT family protein n=1 Tax=Virgibacillus ndiopensis TaxID=2004408 RepID=UPI001FE92A2B|nr:YitT family protein [Virgibacillus ndiopensis]
MYLLIKGGAVIRLMRAGFHLYIMGIIILTLGIALTIQSKLGASPFDSLLVGLHRTFGLTVGSWEIVVGLSMVLCNALVEKKRPEYYAILTSLVTGIGIDSWLFLLRSWVMPGTWIWQSICLGIGIILIGLGIAIYLQSNFAPNPMDRSMLILSKITEWSMTYSRALISVVLVILAYFFDGAIGIGTLLNALFSGVVISFFVPHVMKLINLNRKQEKLAS